MDRSATYDGQEDDPTTPRPLEGIYFTHKNYDRPFRVKISPDLVQVWRRVDNGDDVVRASLQVERPAKVFVGKSPATRMTVRSHSHGPLFDGNAVLVNTQSNDTSGLYFYLFVGHRAYSFQTAHPVVEFVSPVGDNDVSYPYARDAAGRYILFVEKVVLTEPPNPVPDGFDPYNHYYGVAHSTYARILDGVQGFVTSGNEEIHHLNYQCDPQTHYSQPWMRNLRAVAADGSVASVSLDEYIDMHAKIGRALGYEPLVVVARCREGLVFPNQTGCVQLAQATTQQC